MIFIIYATASDYQANFFFLLPTLFTESLPGYPAVVIEMERFTIVSGTFLRRP